MEAQKQEAKKKVTPSVVAGAPGNTTPVVKQTQGEMKHGSTETGS